MPIAAGTDGEAPGGYTLADEVEALVDAGLSPAQALRAATVEAARACRQEDDRGSLAPGMAADVLAVADDPTRHPSALRRVVLVKG